MNIAGVILNKVGGPRHEAKLREAVETYTDLPVVGAVHRNPALEIGERHLGLTTPGETGEFQKMIREIAQIVGTSVDLDLLLEIAGAGARRCPNRRPRPRRPTPDITIAIARDRAFGFYYPDDLEAFARGRRPARAVRHDEGPGPAALRRAVPRRRLPRDVRRRAGGQRDACAPTSGRRSRPGCRPMPNAAG